MTEDNDRAANLAAMYADSEEPEPSRSPLPLRGKMQVIRVGAIEYVVPNVAFVQHLERVIVQQQQDLQQQRQTIERLTARINRIQGASRGHSRSLFNIQHAINTKSDTPSDY